MTQTSYRMLYINLTNAVSIRASIPKLSSGIDKMSISTFDNLLSQDFNSNFSQFISSIVSIIFSIVSIISSVPTFSPVSINSRDRSLSRNYSTAPQYKG